MGPGQRYPWSDEDARAFTDLMLRQSTHFGVIFMDHDGKITGWNRGAGFITGFTEGDVLGRSSAMLFVPEDRANGIDLHERTSAREVGVAEDERWHLRKDGSRYWSSGVSLPLRDPAGEVYGFAKIFRDATHLRTRLEFLENSVRMNAARNDEHHLFIGTIAHELRNPLAPLKTSLQLLGAQPDPSGRTTPVLRIMERQVLALERLIEDLVDLTRVKAGKMKIIHRHARLQDLLFEALENCRPGAERKGVTLQPVFPPVPIDVAVDPGRFDQVLVNLLNNAIKFTDPGGSVWLTCTSDPTHFFVKVKDNGRGIGPELLPTIFEAFTQAPEADSRRGAGLGIGLAVVNEVVHLHGGTVEVRSEGVGKGSEFLVRLPLRP